MTNEKINNLSAQPRVAVFASGTGSNFHAMINDPYIKKHIAILVCDNPNAKAIQIAETSGIPTFVFNPKDYENKITYEEKIIENLSQKNVKWIFLAGYMRIVGETLLTKYDRKIVNIHPSYLPEFPGKDAVGQAIRANVKTTGVTVHFVDEGIDTGPIIEQEIVKIAEGDTVTTLTKKIQQVEHQLYPKVMKQLMGVSK